MECAAFSPDDKLLLTGYNIIAQPHEPGYCQYLRLWDVASGKEIRVLKGHRDTITSVAFLPDNKRALSASMDRTWRLWDVTTGRTLRIFQVPDGWCGPALAADGKRALDCTSHEEPVWRLQMWDLDSGKVIRTFPDDAGEPSAIALSPDGTFALTAARLGDAEGRVRLWDVGKGKVIRALEEKRQMCAAPVGFSPDSKLAASGMRAEDQAGSHIVLWEVASGKEVQTLPPILGRALAVAFTPDGKHLLAGSEDSTIRRWEVRSGKEVWCAHVATLVGGPIAFSPDAKLALVAGGLEFPVQNEKRRLQLWDATTGELLRTLERPHGW